MKKKLFLVFLTAVSVFLPVGSTSALTTTELYNNAANNIFFYVKGDDACNPSTLAEYVATITGDQITWIGDYYSVLARGIIETRYPGVSIFAEEGRNFSETDEVESGIDVAKRLAENNALRKNVVFMLGGNGGANKTEEEVSSMISELLSAIGEDRRVVLMTVRTNVLNYDNFNKAVKKSADNERVLVADFAEAIKDNTNDYFEEGKSYLNEKGLNLLVATVAATLDKFTNNSRSKATSTVGASASALGGESISIDATREERAIYIALRLRGAGYDGDTIAAILGNLEAESSGLNPNNVEKKAGYGGSVDASWRIDNWSGLNKTGFGIVQWTTKDRQLALQKFADENGLPITGLEAQTGFMLQELTTGSRTAKTKVDKIRGKGIELATFIIYREYETPASSYQVKCNKGLCNSYDPTTLDKLSSSSTAWAYSAYSNRLKHAKSYLSLIEANGIEHGSGIVWQGGGGAGVGSSGAICPENAQGAEAIAQLAREMSWPDNSGKCLGPSGSIINFTHGNDSGLESTCGVNPRTKNMEVLRSLGKDAGYGRDCSQFVGSVVKYLKIDDNFPLSGSGLQWQYLKYNDKSRALWTIIENTDNKSTMNLMPGDIAVYPNMSQVDAKYGGGGGGYGHVQIYLGDLGKPWGDAAEASIHHWVARVGNFDLHHSKNPGENTGLYLIARYKGTATVDFGTSTDGGWGEEYGEESEDEEEEETETPSAKNSCGTSKVSQGKVYKDEMNSSQIDFFARVIDSTGCKSLGGCKAAGSFILIKYESGKSSGKEKASLASYLSSKYPQYTNTSNSATSFAKIAAKALIESGDRTLPANTVEMLAPKQVSVIKIDGTDATRKKGGNVIKKSELDGLIPGTSTGIINGYGKDELKFFCATKDSSGNYIHLFWQKDNTPSGQETK